MNAPARFRQSDVTRALKGCAAAKVAVQRADILPDGTIRIILGDGGAPDDPNPWDALETR